MRTRRSLTPVVVEQGPYTEMFDALDPAVAQPGRAALLQNVYPLDAEEGEGLVGRPGFAASDTAGQTGLGQGVHQFTKLDGTETRCYVFAGSLYTWSTTQTATDLTVLGLSATARVSMVTFANTLILSDGLMSPIQWDGKSTFTVLTNCPPLYGQPTVYSAKLFGIKASDRATFVWSEENNPAIGYQATVSGFTYANAWTIAQTDANPLVALRGTNAALYYWRERSTGAVFGKVNSTFVTTATHDALSTTVGTKSAWGIAAHGEGFLFPDADGRPHRLVPRGGVVPVWQPFRETLVNIPRASLVNAIGIDYPAARLVLIGYAETLQTYPTVWLVYRDTPDGFKAAGIFRGFTATAAGVVKDDTGVPVWVHLDASGHVYRHGNPDGVVWDDAGVAITHVVQATPMAGDGPSDIQFTRLDLFTRVTGPLTLTLDYATPRGPSAASLALPVGPVAGLGVALYDDVALYDVAQYVAGAVEVKTTVGWSGVGRWIQPRLTHATVGEQFAFLKWRVLGQPLGTHPSAP